MIHIRMLGPPGIEASAAAGPADRAADLLRQPKAIALLAYLALATPRGFHSRDTLMALLWPELDEDRGRKALRQTLYEIRSALGKAAIENRGYDAVSLGGEVVAVDAVALEELLEAGEAEAALELYRGELLEGFWVPEASVEWEQWLDGERSRLARLARNAAEELGAGAAVEVEAAASSETLTSDRLERAIALSRRAVELAPLDEGPVARLLGLLGVAGRRSGIEESYAAYAARLEEVLGTNPSSAVRDARDEALAATPIVTSGAGAPPSGSEPRSGAEPEEHGTAAGGVGTPRPPRRRLPRLAAPVVGVVLLMLAAAAALALRSRLAPSAEPAVVVLPFQALSADDAPLAAGLHQEVTSSLVRMPGLRTIDGSGIGELGNIDGAALSRTAGAGTVLKASVRREEGRVRVTAQLVSTGDRSVVWSESYDRRLDMRALFDIQGDIGRSIARSLARELAPPDSVDRAIPTSSVEAYELYQEGLRHIDTRTLATQWAAHDAFRRALKLDPSFAQAQAWLSMAFGGLWQLTYEREFADSARVHAAAVVRNRPDLAEGHVALGSLHQSVDGDHATAEIHLRRALEIDPNHQLALQLVSRVHRASHEWVEALRGALTAAHLNPFSLQATQDVIWRYINIHDFEAAEEWIHWRLELGADSMRSYDGLYYPASARGDSALLAHIESKFEEWSDGTPYWLERQAFVAFRRQQYAAADSLWRLKWERLDPSIRETEFTWTDLAWTRRWAGDTARAEELLDLSKRAAQGRRPISRSWVLAQVYSMRGRVDSAAAALGVYTAEVDGAGFPYFLDLYPVFENVRYAPEIRALADRVLENTAEARARVHAELPERLRRPPHLRPIGEPR